jgi:aspartate racemase
MSTVGIVGGVGPLAASHFYQRLLALSGADRDQDFPPAVLIADQMPSRIAHLQGSGCSPLPVLLKVAARLVAAGANSIAIPSVTTHAYRAEIAASVDVPVYDLPAEIGAFLSESAYRSPLFLGTSATVGLRLLDRYLPAGTRLLYPDAAGQAVVNSLIDRVKAGRSTGGLRDELAQWINGCTWSDATDSVILGCTELSLINPGAGSSLPVVDTTEVLVRVVLRAITGGTVRIADECKGIKPKTGDRQWAPVVSQGGGRGIWPTGQMPPSGWRTTRLPEGHIQ